MTQMRTVGKVLPSVETTTGEGLAAAGACIIPFELRTESGSRITLNIRFQLSNVRTPNVAVEDLLESGVQPFFHTLWQLVRLFAKSRQLQMPRIRWMRATRLNELSEDAYLVASLGASRSGLVALEAEPRLEIPGFAEPHMVEGETELQL